MSGDYYFSMSLSSINPMNGTTPVPGPTIIIGIAE